MDNESDCFPVRLPKGEGFDKITDEDFDKLKNLSEKSGTSIRCYIAFLIKKNLMNYENILRGLTNGK